MSMSSAAAAFPVGLEGVGAAAAVSSQSPPVDGSGFVLLLRDRDFMDGMSASDDTSLYV